jgi:hypothetical protein
MRSCLFLDFLLFFFPLIFEAFPNGTNAAAPSVQSSHDFALVVRGLPNRTKMDRAVGSEKVLSGKE